MKFDRGAAHLMLNCVAPIQVCGRCGCNLIKKPWHGMALRYTIELIDICGDDRGRILSSKGISLEAAHIHRAPAFFA